MIDRQTNGQTDRQTEIGEIDKVSLSHFHVFKELRISHFFNNDVNEVLAIFYCLYLRKDFLVLAKQQALLRTMCSRLPQQVASSFSSPTSQGQASGGPDELKPRIEAHMHTVQAHLSIHISQETATDLLTKGP